MVGPARAVTIIRFASALAGLVSAVAGRTVHTQAVVGAGVASQDIAADAGAGDFLFGSRSFLGRLCLGAVARRSFGSG